MRRFQRPKTMQPRYWEEQEEYLHLLVNGITSGGIVFTFVDSLSSVISSRRAVVLILLIVALMVYVFITFLSRKLILLYQEE